MNTNYEKDIVARIKFNYKVALLFVYVSLIAATRKYLLGGLAHFVLPFPIRNNSTVASSIAFRYRVISEVHDPKLS